MESWWFPSESEKRALETREAAASAHYMETISVLVRFHYTARMTFMLSRQNRQQRLEKVFEALDKWPVIRLYWMTLSIPGQSIEARVAKKGYDQLEKDPPTDIQVKPVYEYRPH